MFRYSDNRITVLKPIKNNKFDERITENYEEFFTTLPYFASASGVIRAYLPFLADEIFSNIALYSGATEAKFGSMVSENCLTLRISDNGVQYDPTKNPDPDTTLSADERKIGGLRIFMVKKMMDVVSYEYIEGRNVLTVTKKL